MSDQGEMDFDGKPPVKDGYEAPPLSHRDGPDTEKLAAEKMKPSAAKWRRDVRDFALEQGPFGITGYEACVHFDSLTKQSTVRARLTELCDEKHGKILTKSERRRPNGNGNSEIVYMATRFA